MTSFVLRLIAMITMAIDHTGIVFFDNYPVMRGIGRIAFPLYAFLLAEGFMHVEKNQDRVKNHIIRLALIALISEPIYDFTLYPDRPLFSHQNVIFTFLIAYIALAIITLDAFPKWAIPIVIVLGGWLTFVLHTSYDAGGYLLVLMMYYYVKKNDPWHWALKLLYLFFSINIFIIVIYSVHDPFAMGLIELYQLIFDNPWRYCMFMPVIFIFFYNHEKGYDSPIFSWIYRLFYPLHLGVINILMHIL